MYESVAKLPCGEVTVAKLPCGEVTGNPSKRHNFFSMRTNQGLEKPIVIDIRL